MDARPPAGGEGELPPGATPESPAPRFPSAWHATVFLFCDIRGYTGYTEQRGAEAAARLVSTFMAFADEAISGHGGTLRGTWGDQVLGEFASAREGVRAAVELQQRCVDVTLAYPGEPLLVGIGLDVGEPAGSPTAASGSALNVAARLCAKAAPGQLLATRELVHLAGTVPGLSFQECGRIPLKGIPGKTSVVTIAPAGPDPQRAEQFRQIVTGHGRAWSRRLLPWVAIVSALAVLVSVVVWVRRQHPPQPIPPGGVAVLDPRSGRLQQVSAVGGSPGGVGLGPDALWVVQSEADAVVRLDRGTRAVVDTVPVGLSPNEVAVSGDDVWVVDAGEGTVSWVKASTHRRVLQPPVGTQPTDIAIGFGRVWVTNEGDSTVTVLDAKTGRLVTTLDVGDGPVGVAVGADRVWVSNARENTVSSIDPRALHVDDTYTVGSGPGALVAGPRGVWVVNTLDLTVSHIDPATRRVRSTLPVGDSPSSVVQDGNTVWVGNAAAGTLTRIDARHDRVLRTVALGASPTGLALDRSRLWVATRPFASSGHKGGTLTSVTSAPLDSIDPQVAFSPAAMRALNLVHAGLLTNRRANGSTYDLVPDLAVTVPRPTDKGRTYTFTLHPGIRYSDGRPLAPGDFRRGLEREFTVSRSGLGNPLYYEAIVGARACLGRAVGCDLRAGITTGPATVTFHLVRPDPDFLDKLSLPYAVPVPPGTPTGVAATYRIPGTGPYAVTSFTPGKALTLGRNRWFRQWSFAAHPTGYPDVLQFRAATTAVGIAQVEGGSADLFNTVRPEGLGTARLRFASRVHREVVDATRYLALDPSRAPFNRQQARQAVAYALDRAAVAAPYGLATTCQLPPPNFPGHQRYCRFTRDPDGTGVWHGPDLPRARRLVAASGTSGATVHVRVEATTRGGKVEATARGAEVGAVLARMLTAIGYRPQLDPVDDDTYQGPGGTRAAPLQMGVEGWLADYAAASHFYDPVLSCAAFKQRDVRSDNGSRFCDAGAERLAAAARSAQATDPALARRLWQQLYRYVDAAAPVVPIGNFVATTLVSPRVGNYQANAFWGPLVEQMWVH